MGIVVRFELSGCGQGHKVDSNLTIHHAQVTLNGELIIWIPFPDSIKEFSILEHLINFRLVSSDPHRLSLFLFIVINGPAGTVESFTTATIGEYHVHNTIMR